MERGCGCGEVGWGWRRQERAAAAGCQPCASVPAPVTDHATQQCSCHPALCGAAHFIYSYSSPPSRSVPAAPRAPACAAPPLSCWCAAAAPTLLAGAGDEGSDTGAARLLVLSAPPWPPRAGSASAALGGAAGGAGLPGRSSSCAAADGLAGPLPRVASWSVGDGGAPVPARSGESCALGEPGLPTVPCCGGASGVGPVGGWGAYG